jgi:hypothetical protein
MKSKSIIIINNNLLYIDRYFYESDEMFYYRIKYILNNYKNNKNIDDLIGLSMIEMNKKFNKTIYQNSSCL